MAPGSNHSCDTQVELRNETAVFQQRWPRPGPCRLSPQKNDASVAPFANSFDGCEGSSPRCGFGRELALIPRGHSTIHAFALLRSTPRQQAGGNAGAVSTAADADNRPV